MFLEGTAMYTVKFTSRALPSVDTGAGEFYKQTPPQISKLAT